MTDISITTQRHKGFSLIELLVAMAIGALLMTLVAAVYYGQTTSSATQQQVMSMQQNLRTAIFLMERDIMMAGYEPDPTANAGAGIITATNTTFVFSFVDPVTRLDGIDNDNDGAVDEALEKDGVNNDCDADTDEQNELETVRFRLFDSLGDGDDDLMRDLLCANGSARNSQALVEDVEAIEFLYTLANGTQTTNPVAADLRNIRTVGISILARTAVPTRSYVDRLTYTALSGNLLSPPAGFGDRYRRQMLTVTVQCRNMN